MAILLLWDYVITVNGTAISATEGIVSCVAATRGGRSRSASLPVTRGSSPAITSREPHAAPALPASHPSMARLRVSPQ